MMRAERDSGNEAGWRIGVALSPRLTAFGPMLFAGRLAEGLQLSAELGFDVVELSLRDAGDVDLASLKSSLRDSSLTVSAIATGQACLFDGLCLSASDPAIRKATVEHLKREAQLAAELGASIVFGGIKGRLEGDASSRSVQSTAAMAALAECVRAAVDLGVDPLLEPINRYETNFVNTVDEALALLEQLGLSHLRLLLDTFHMNIEEVDIIGAVQRAGPHLGYLHVADSNRRAPGQGHIPFEAILSALAAMDFAGPVVSEILPLPDDATAARQTAAFWSAWRGSSRASKS